MASNSDINWNRIVAEGAAIVASILLAFAIDAWWDARNDRAKAEELLAALEIEWNSEANRIDSSLAMYDDAMAAMIAAVNAHASGGENVPEDKAREILRDARKFSTYKPSVAAYEVLLAYGLDHIEDPKLRLAIASWRSVLDEIVPEQDAIHEIALIAARERRARIAHNFEQPWQVDDDQETGGRMGTYGWFGVEPGMMALASIEDHDRAVIQRHQLNLLATYQRELFDVREVLRQNLAIFERRNRK